MTISKRTEALSDGKLVGTTVGVPVLRAVRDLPKDKTISQRRHVLGPLYYVTPYTHPQTPQCMSPSVGGSSLGSRRAAMDATRRQSNREPGKNWWI